MGSNRGMRRPPNFVMRPERMVKKVRAKNGKAEVEEQDRLHHPLPIE